MSPKSRVAWIRIAAVAIPATALWLLLPRVPFVASSYTLWGCIFALPVLIFALVRPIPALFLGDRRISAICLAVACVAGAMGLFWPLPTLHTPAGVSLLDKYMPDWNAGEKHSIAVPARPEQVWSALRSLTFRDIPATSVLGGIRSIAFGGTLRPSDSNRPVLSTILAPGSAFFLLEEHVGKEVVIGMLGKPWRNLVRKVDEPGQFLTWNEPDSVRIAMNIRVEPDAGFTRLTTETRIRGNDAAATRHFGLYWRLMYPGSAVIRHQVLASVAEKSNRF